MKIKVRRWPIVLFAVAALGLAELLIWAAWAIVPSDLGGLAELMRPLLPLAALAALVEVGRYFRGAWVGTIEVTDAGLVLPWFWRSSRRLTPWSSVAAAEIDTVVGLGVRTVRLRLIGTDGSVRAFVAKRWVQRWDVMLDAIGDRIPELRTGSSVGVWDAAAADGTIRPRPRWLPRLQKCREDGIGSDPKDGEG